MSARTPNAAEVLRTAIENRLVDVHTMMAGKIDSYDPKTQKADVKPMVRRLQETEDGKALDESIPVIPAVPVAFFRAGGFKLTAPPQKGDRCMLVFSETSIDNYQASQSDDEVKPEVFERFNLTDAVVWPGWYPDAKALEETDPDDMVMGKDGGEVIHIGRDQINLYEKDAKQPVSLADSTKSELDKAKANTQKVLDYVEQIKAVFALGTPVPMDGGAAVLLTQTGASQALVAPSLEDHESVAAEKVFAT